VVISNRGTEKKTRMLLFLRCRWWKYFEEEKIDAAEAKNDGGKLTGIDVIYLSLGGVKLAFGRHDEKIQLISEALMNCRN
jgi:hypothetical protein